MVRFTFTAFLLSILALTGLVSCGPGGQATLLPEQPVPPVLVATPVHIPTGMPNDGVQPWETLNANGQVVPLRETSAINQSTDFTAGVERFQDGGVITANGEALSLNAMDDSGLSYAIYRVSLQVDQPGVVSVNVNLLSGQSEYYVGLSNYDTASWQWQGPFSDNQVRLQAASNAADGYTNGLGNFFVAVVADQGSSFDIVGVGVNNLDLADTSAPAPPLGLSATPVNSGLELSWLASLEPDLAGYRIHYAEASFNAFTDTGVSSVNYIEGGLHLVLRLPATTTFVRLTALDFSGNESELSAEVTATPLGDAFVPILLASDVISTGINGSIQLTATGSALYDWDLNGDGIFEVQDDAAGLQSANTTASGIIMPLVRGHNAGQTAVALGGLSLIVVGNTRPVASATATPQYGVVPLSVTFTGTAEDIEDEPGELVVSWDFNGDGIYDLTGVLSPTGVNYNSAGLFNVKFRVEDTEGVWAIDTLAIQATDNAGNNLAPTAVLDWSADVTPYHYLNDDDDQYVISMNGLSSTDPENDALTYWLDEHGSGAFVEDADGNFSITFTQPGVYPVALKVSDTAGNYSPAAVIPITIYRMRNQELPYSTLNTGVAMAIIGSKPAVAFYQSTNLMYGTASDSRVSGWDTAVDTGNTVSPGTQSMWMLEVGGRPAIAYRDGNAVKYCRATNDNGSTWGAGTTIATEASMSPQSITLALIGGLPAVAFTDDNDDVLSYARATTVEGTTWSVLVDVDANVGTITSQTKTSLAEIGGRPAIAYNQNIADDLQYIRADDSVGASWPATPQVLVTGGSSVDTSVELVVLNGNPAIFFGQARLYEITATNSTGTSWNTPLLLDIAGGNTIGSYCAVALSDNNVVVVHMNSFTDNLRLVYSNDTTGLDWGLNRSIQDSGGNRANHCRGAANGEWVYFLHVDFTTSKLRLAWNTLN